MENNKMNLEKLGKIKQVDAPPFLFTRIQEKIKQKELEKMPVRTAWVVSFSFVLLLAINSFVLINYQSKSNDVSDYASSMGLTSNYSLYNE